MTPVLPPEGGLSTILMPNEMSRGLATILSLATTPRPRQPANAAFLSLPFAPGSAFQRPHSSAGNTRDRADYQEGIAGRQPCLRGRGHTGIPARIQAPSSGRWERCASAGGPHPPRFVLRP